MNIIIIIIITNTVDKFIGKFVFSSVIFHVATELY